MVTPEQHILKKQAELASSISGRIKVYLDLNFWILARDAASGENGGPTEHEILRLLRQGVAEKKLLCPISDSFFFELDKQPNSDDRRVGTARMVDELSCGLAITNMVDRIGLEVRAFFQKAVSKNLTLDLNEVMWTHVTHVLGAINAPMPGIDPVVEVEWEKWRINDLWRMPFVKFIQMIGAADREPSDSFVALAADTNKERDAHADEITSFDKAYEVEITGGIGVAGVFSPELMADFAAWSGHKPPAVGSKSWLTCENGVKNALRQAFLQRKNIHKTIRTLHIVASLHASMRYDKARRFKPNDYHDFNHAAAAVGYCDLFLTDSPLRELASRPQLNLISINSCQIISDREQAVEALRTICA